MTNTEKPFVKCDGNHGGPRCGDPECWNDSPEPPVVNESFTTGATHKQSLLVQPVTSVPDGLIAALRNQRQIDRDSTEVAVSRQAVDEAADLLARYGAPVAAQPIATLYDDGHYIFNGTPPHESLFAGWKLDVYTTPQPTSAQPADPVKWQDAQQIADLPEVDELLAGFVEDPTGDAGTMIVRAVMQAVRQPAASAEPVIVYMYPDKQGYAVHGTVPKDTSLRPGNNTLYTAPVVAQPRMPDGWEGQIFAEMERRFKLKGEENQYERLRIDDTQIGVEFALDQMRAMLTATPPADGQAQQDADKVDAQSDSMLIATARRNIRAFISKASFAMEIDRQAALTCIDVLESAIDAQPDPAMAEDDRAAFEGFVREQNYLADDVEIGKFPDGDYTSPTRQKLWEYWQASSKRLQPASGEDARNSERLRFLHSVNKDAEGYEYGVARVKFDQYGQVESFLWSAADSSDIDAAMQQGGQ